MTVHHLHHYFLRFIDALAAGEGDPWDLYCRHYLNPNRAALDAWWSQVLGLPESTWVDRVRHIRPEEYELLRELVREEDLEAVAREAMARCEAVLPMRPEPKVYYLVGFFSPDGFAFEVEGEWAIGIGLERLTSTRLIPVLLAHEYAHCYRRRAGRPKRLGERMVEEGFAVELAAQAFPERPEHEHLLMQAGQVVALRGYERALWEAVAPLLDSEDEALATRVLYGQAKRDEMPSRAGMYLGWLLVREFMDKESGGFDTPAEQVLAVRRAGS